MTDIIHKLMIKTHIETGLQYLCYTTKDDHETYPGSGKLWKKWLELFGNDIATDVIFETTDYKQFVVTATDKSNEYDVVKSPNWANLKPETGQGGDTVSDKMWINNGVVSKYHYRVESIPDGWVKGRINCVFNDSEKQKEYSKRSNHQTDKQKSASKRMGSANAGHKHSVGSKNTQSRPIQTPYGPFGYIQECVNTTGLLRTKINKYLIDPLNTEWTYL